MLKRNYRAGEIEKEEITYEDSRFPVVYLTAYDKEPRLGFIPHIHSDIFEILHVEKSSANITCENHKYTAQAGDIFIFNPGEIHSCLSTQAEYTSKCIQFSYDLLASKYIDTCEKNYIYPVFHGILQFKTLHRNDQTLIALFKEAQAAILEKKIGSELAVKGCLLKILAHLMQTGIRKDGRSSATHNDANVERVNAIISYIAEHYPEPITSKDIISPLYLSQSYVCRLFKQYTNKSVLEYLTHYRIVQALNLLTNTDLTISAISSAVGFEDFNYFSRTFKKYIGLPPSEIRKHNGQTK